jgi:hypothetical protein
MYRMDDKSLHSRKPLGVGPYRRLSKYNYNLVLRRRLTSDEQEAGDSVVFGLSVKR